MLAYDPSCMCRRAALEHDFFARTLFVFGSVLYRIHRDYIVEVNGKIRVPKEVFMCWMIV